LKFPRVRVSIELETEMVPSLSITEPDFIVQVETVIVVDTPKALVNFYKENKKNLNSYSCTKRRRY
jgi:hypothetical protein